VRGSKSQQKAARVATFSGAVEDVGGLVFDEGDWLACPKDLETPLISATEIGSKTITITVVVDEVRLPAPVLTKSEVEEIVMFTHSARSVRPVSCVAAGRGECADV
jgi:hypothetical protein